MSGQSSDERAAQIAMRTASDTKEELLRLRSLSLVERHAPTLEQQFRTIYGQPSSNGGGEPPSPSHRRSTVTDELSGLSSARRVSGMSARFRTSLESIFRSGPPQRRAPEPAPPRSRRFFPSAPAQQAAPPIARTSAIESLAEASIGELRELELSEMVRQRLNNGRFVERLEQMLRSRISEPHEGDERARHLQSLLASRRSSSTERAARRDRVRAVRANQADRIGRDALRYQDTQQRENQEAAQLRATNVMPPTAGSDRELHNMAGATFQLLLSLQRSLQQEVSAAMQDRQQGASPSVERPAFQSAASVPKFSLGACVICCESEVSTVFYRCGHMCSCAACAHMLCSREGKCPICRAPVRDVIQAFVACAPGSLADG